MSVIRWEDPPESQKGKLGRRGWGRNPRWQAVADALRANPGRWAVVAEGENAGISGHIRSGRYAAMRPAGSFEAQAVGSNGAFPIVYARYVGEAGSEATPKSKNIDGGPAATSPAAGPDACRDMPPSTTPGECPAHGFHPHNGMTCLDCPVCRPAEPTKGGTE